MQEVCGWINAKANRPVWAKMTPNITDITDPARTALAAGCEGVAAINTITSGKGCAPLTWAYVEARPLSLSVLSITHEARSMPAVCILVPMWTAVHTLAPFLQTGACTHGGQATQGYCWADVRNAGRECNADCTPYLELPGSDAAVNLETLRPHDLRGWARHATAAIPAWTSSPSRPY